MKLLILIVLFCSYFTQAQSAKCLSIIDSNQSLETKVNNLIELEDSWSCLNQFYNAITNEHFNITYQTLNLKDPIIQSVINVPARIRHLVDQYAEHGLRSQFTAPNFFNSYPFVLFLSNFFSSQHESFSRRRSNVFESFPLELKQHLSSLTLRNQFLANPYTVLMMSNPSLLPMHGQEFFLPPDNEMNLNTKTVSIDFPTFILCPEANEDMNPSWGKYYNGIHNRTVKYIEKNTQTLSLYLSVLDFYNISQGQNPNLIPTANRVIYSFPYGFEYENIPLPLLSRLPETEKESLFQWIQQIKKFTFARILFGGHTGCLPNIFQETLLISYTDILPKPITPASASQKETSKIEDFSPFFEIQYSLSEYPIRSLALENSIQSISYHKSAIYLKESIENDFLENQHPEFFRIEQPLSKIVLGKEL